MYVCGQGVCVPMSNDCQRGVQEDPVILEDVDMSTVHMGKSMDNGYVYVENRTVEHAWSVLGVG